MSRALFPALAFAVLILPSAAIVRAAAQSGAAPVVLPLETAAGHLVVDLEERTLGNLRLLVDTGAEKSLLSAQMAAKTKVDPHFTDRFYTFNGFGQGQKARLKGHVRLDLEASSRDLGAVDALVLDGENIDVGVRPPVDGTLGWDFFQHRCVLIDSKARQMIISGEQHCAPHEAGFYAPPAEWLRQGLLLPVTVTLSDKRVLKLSLHVDTGSDGVVLSPRLRGLLGIAKEPEAAFGNSGKGVNGSYVFDVVNATKIEAEGGHPTLEGTIPLVVMRDGSYSRPHWLFSGVNEAKLFRDGVVGNNVLGFYELLFDPANKKLYERAYSFQAR